MSELILENIMNDIRRIDGRLHASIEPIVISFIKESQSTCNDRIVFFRAFGARMFAIMVLYRFHECIKMFGPGLHRRPKEYEISLAKFEDIVANGGFHTMFSFAPAQLLSLGVDWTDKSFKNYQKALNQLSQTPNDQLFRILKTLLRLIMYMYIQMGRTIHHSENLLHHVLQVSAQMQLPLILQCQKTAKIIAEHTGLRSTVLIDSLMHIYARYCDLTLDYIERRKYNEETLSRRFVRHFQNHIVEKESVINTVNLYKTSRLERDQLCVSDMGTLETYHTLVKMLVLSRYDQLVSGDGVEDQILYIAVDALELVSASPLSTYTTISRFKISVVFTLRHVHPVFDIVGAKPI